MTLLLYDFNVFSFKGHAVLNWHVFLFLILLPIFASILCVPFSHFSYSLLNLSLVSFS